MKTTGYFTTSVMACRPYLRMKWIVSVLTNHTRTQVQKDERICRWALTPDVGKYLLGGNRTGWVNHA
jgi:hypothetical protein